MRTHVRQEVCAVLPLLAIAAVVVGQTPLGTAFTYQGQLKQGGLPVMNTADFQFTLWDALVDGNQIGATIPVSGKSVVNGLFTETLDFGAGAFIGEARWLEIAVRSPSTPGGTFTTLSPRQELKPTPYALYALNGPGGEAWSLTGNAGTDPNTNFLGTTDNVALQLHVNGSRVLRIEPMSDPESGFAPNVIGGYSGNAATAGTWGATIGGGGYPPIPNLVTDAYGTVAGGTGNRAGDDDGDPETAGNAFVGGGHGNHATAYFTSVAGGLANEATAQGATVSGGQFNEASGYGAAVPGGGQNVAAGSNSMAAGYEAAAMHGGTFVWADFTGAPFTSTAGNQFLIRAGGGVGIGTNAPTSPLTVNGLVESLAGGFKFPDGSVQATAAAGGDAWSLTGNAGTTPGTHFLGTTDDQALEFHVNGGRALRIEPTTSSPNIIGGFSGNQIADGALGVTIFGGGGAGGLPNQVRDNYGTVGGGYNNSVGDADGDPAAASCATVAGGVSNLADGSAATVGGGSTNSARSQFATVAGGLGNQADGPWATVAGGEYNSAAGYYAAVPGGDYNSAAGGYSLAAGHRAKANNIGTFVWADSTLADFASTAADQFLIRASGGVGINTNDPAGYDLNVNGSAYKSEGGEHWAVPSDARLKQSISPLRGALQRLLKLQGRTFEFRAGTKFTQPGTQVGFVAQEVEQVFPEWVTENADGYKYLNVRGAEALVVEALRELRQEKDAEIAAQAERLGAQERELSDLRARMARLEELLTESESTQTGGRP